MWILNKFFWEFLRKPHSGLSLGIPQEVSEGFFTNFFQSFIQQFLQELLRKFHHRLHSWSSLGKIFQEFWWEIPMSFFGNSSMSSFENVPSGIPPGVTVRILWIEEALLKFYLELLQDLLKIPPRVRSRIAPRIILKNPQGIPREILSGVLSRIRLRYSIFWNSFRIFARSCLGHSNRSSIGISSGSSFENNSSAFGIGAPQEFFSTFLGSSSGNFFRTSFENSSGSLRSYPEIPSGTTPASIENPETPSEVILGITPRFFSKIHQDIPRAILPGVLPRIRLKKSIFWIFSGFLLEFLRKFHQKFH